MNVDRFVLVESCTFQSGVSSNISDDVRVGQFLDSMTKQGSRWVKMQPGNSTQSRKKRCIRFLRVVTLRSHRIAIVTCLHTCTGTANRLCKSHAMCKSAKSCAKGKVQITSFALAVQKSPACGCIVTAALLHHAPRPHTHMGPMDVVMAPKPPQ